MKKKIIVCLLSTFFIVSACSCASSGVSQEEYDKVVAERDQYKAQLDEISGQSSNEENQTSETSETNSTPEESTEEYKIGETWEVDGKFKLTVDSVVATDERNEYDTSNPAAVYIITYTYENLGIGDTLYISMEDMIVDSTGAMGESYPGETEMYPQDVPVGANCQAQACISVKNPGSFKDYVSVYDDSFNEYKAIFNLDIQ